MQILAGLAILAAMYVLIYVMGMGLANAMDLLSYNLHVWAVSLRRDREKHTKIIGQRWVRQLEASHDA